MANRPNYIGTVYVTNCYLDLVWIYTPNTRNTSSVRVSRLQNSMWSGSSMVPNSCTWPSTRLYDWVMTMCMFSHSVRISCDIRPLNIHFSSSSSTHENVEIATNKEKRQTTSQLLNKPKNKNFKHIWLFFRDKKFTCINLSRACRIAHDGWNGTHNRTNPRIQHTQALEWRVYGRVQEQIGCTQSSCQWIHKKVKHSDASHAANSCEREGMQSTSTAIIKLDRLLSNPENHFKAKTKNPPQTTSNKNAILRTIHLRVIRHFEKLKRYGLIIHTQ